jgi:hypothetical protein
LPLNSYLTLPSERNAPLTLGFARTTSMTHTIRLRGSWETSSDGTRTHHVRKFGRPRLPDPAERVWLVCELVPGAAEVSVNGRVVGALAGAGSFAADVTELLEPRNAVRFAVASGEPLGEVALEIRAATN